MWNPFFARSRSARRPSPVWLCEPKGPRTRARARTNYKHQTLRLRVSKGVLLHAMDDGAGEVAVEDSPYIDEMKDEADEKELPDRARYRHSVV